MSKVEYAGVVVGGDDKPDCPARSAPIKVTPADKRRTGKFLTKFEVAKVVGWRAAQIASGQRNDMKRPAGAETPSFLGSSRGAQRPPLSPKALYEKLSQQKLPAPLALDGTANKKPVKRARPSDGASGADMAVYDPVALAKQELLHGLVPAVVRRVFPNGRDFEDIPVAELRLDKAWLDFDAAKLPSVFQA